MTGLQRLVVVDVDPTLGRSLPLQQGLTAAENASGFPEAVNPLPGDGLRRQLERREKEIIMSDKPDTQGTPDQSDPEADTASGGAPERPDGPPTTTDDKGTPVENPSG